MANNELSSKYPTASAVETALDAGMNANSKVADLELYAGKYKVVLEATSMAVNSSTFASNSIVKGTADITITEVANLDYEVVFDMASGKKLTINVTLPTIGSYDSSKRNVYSILNGTLVIGNF